MNVYKYTTKRTYFSEYENIKKGRCYCEPAKGFSSARGLSGEEQLGEGCTKKDAENFVVFETFLPSGEIIASRESQPPQRYLISC